MRYDFDAKQFEYRVPLWTAVDHLTRTPRALRRVVYLDTAQALDTIELLQRGYSPQNLHPVNRSAAQVAALTAKLDRLGLPRVNTHGADFVETVSGWRGDGFDVVAFDGCENLSGPTWSFLSGLSTAIQDRVPSIVAFTLLGGREGPIETELNQFLSRYFSIVECRTSRGKDQRTHFLRLSQAVMRITCSANGDCLAHCADVRWNHYRSASGQPMVWGVLLLRPHSPIRGTSKDQVRRWKRSASRQAFRLGLLPPCLGLCGLARTVADVERAAANHAASRDRLPSDVRGDVETTISLQRRLRRTWQ